MWNSNFYVRATKCVCALLVVVLGLSPAFGQGGGLFRQGGGLFGGPGGFGNVPVQKTHPPVRIVPELAENAQVRVHRSGVDDAAMATLERALKQPVDFNFHEVPLEDILDHIAENHKVEIITDRKGLTDAGIDQNTPSTYTVKGISLRSAMKHLLDQLQLKAIARNGTLTVTSREVGDNRLETRVYDVAELQAAVSQPTEDLDDIIDLLTSALSPSTWNEAGGPASISAFRGRLVVTNTTEVHDQIAALLNGLAAAVLQQVTAKDTRRYAPLRPDVTEAATAIDKKLDGRLDLQFRESPLSQVAKSLREKLEMEVQLDGRALQNAGIDDAAPVTFKTTNLTVRSALTYMLAQYDLTWLIEDEMLLITTKESANTKFVTRIFPVADLLGDLNEPDYDKLMDSIARAIEPNSWSDSGGPATIHPAAAAGCLVISQTPAVHREVEELLVMLRKSAESQPAMAASPRRVLRVYLLAASPAPEVQPRPQSPRPPGTTPAGAAAGSVVVVPTNMPDPQRPTAAELSALVQERIAPHSWPAFGGRGYIRDLTGAIVIEHTPQVHAEVQKLLAPFGVKVEAVNE